MLFDPIYKKNISVSFKIRYLSDTEYEEAYM